ncbi:tetratricopeptide repeat protein [Streptomyces sp. NPDC056337]|uniref:tetratricopeptide repeat protein n=1 Tax=Streptomyces sp. NPDC056337 TaxID=3345787 RepID=UPI0035D7C28E
MSGGIDRRPDVAASGDESVAAGRDIGTAVTAPGAIGTQNVVEHHTHLAAVAPDSVPLAEYVEAPQGLTNLPERPRLFVGRTRELDQLRAATEAGDGPLAHVVHGLGGVGKSTLAAYWASEHARHSPVWWLSGDSPATLDAGLCALATAVAPALAGYMQQGQLRDWALQWLTTHEDWLLVLDNVADPADVKPLLAAVPAGRFLITSRRSTGWHGVAERISLDTLEPDEAADLFGRIAPDAGDGIPAVCSELGCLPLAVEQAAAYCLETGTAADEYLALLAEYPADMYTAAVEGGDMQRTVARVWHVTLDRLADDPLAVTILLTVSWFAPDDIPRSLLDGLGTPPAVRRAIGRLSAHSMVTLHGTTTLSVHRLVQAVSRTPDLEDPHRQAEAVSGARDLAAERLAESVPDDGRDPVHWPLWRTLLPHVEALAAHIPADGDTVTLARVFSEAGEFAVNQELADRATALLRRGESGTRRLLGADHPQSLVARNRLMGMEPLPVEQALHHVSLCERVFGKQHPHAITAHYELTASYLEGGDIRRAQRNIDAVVEMRARVLGPDHVDTLEARWGGLMIVARQGDLDTVARLVEPLMRDCVRALGARHPLTLDARGLRAQLTSKVGRSFAAPAYSTLDADSGLNAAVIRAAIERLQNELDPAAVRAWATESIAEATRYLADCEAVLGQEHRDTITARVNLAQMYMGADDPDAALLHGRQAAAEAERHLGAGSSVTFLARLLLASLSVATKDAAIGADAISGLRLLAEGIVTGDGEEKRRAVDALEAVLLEALTTETDSEKGTE